MKYKIEMGSVYNHFICDHCDKEFYRIEKWKMKKGNEFIYLGYSDACQDAVEMHEEEHELIRNDKMINFLGKI